MTRVDPKNIYQSIDGFAIASDEYSDNDIEVDCGGDSSEVIKGKAGGSDTLYKYDKVDTIKFSLRKASPSSYRLMNYYYQKQQIADYICKDSNPDEQRTWTSTAVNVKGFETVNLTDGKGIAFTLECEKDLEVS